MLAETSNLTKRIGELQTKQQGNGMIKSRHPLFLAASHHNVLNMKQFVSNISNFWQLDKQDKHNLISTRNV